MSIKQTVSNGLDEFQRRNSLSDKPPATDAASASASEARVQPPSAQQLQQVPSASILKPAPNPMQSFLQRNILCHPTTETAVPPTNHPTDTLGKSASSGSGSGSNRVITRMSQLQQSTSSTTVFIKVPPSPNTVK